MLSSREAERLTVNCEEGEIEREKEREKERESCGGGGGGEREVKAGPVLAITKFGNTKSICTHSNGRDSHP
jgi:hypothetical protein